MLRWEVQTGQGNLGFSFQMVGLDCGLEMNRPHRLSFNKPGAPGIEIVQFTQLDQPLSEYLPANLELGWRDTKLLEHVTNVHLAHA